MFSRAIRTTKPSLPTHTPSKPPRSSPRLIPSSTPTSPLLAFNNRTQSRAYSRIPTRPHTRKFTTTTRTHRPASNAPFPQILERQHNRPLPTLASLSSRRRWLLTLPIFLGVITASALGIFNYQKVNSPIITANLYALRTNDQVRQKLGDEVYFASKWAWVWGRINLVQGNIDVGFWVKGTREKGWCVFKAKRFGGKGGSFKTSEWSLKLEDGSVINLLAQQQKLDPLSQV